MIRPIADRTCAIRAPSASVAARIIFGSSVVRPERLKAPGELPCGVTAIPPDIGVTPSAFVLRNPYRHFRRGGDATYIACLRGRSASTGEGYVNGTDTPSDLAAAQLAESAAD